MFLMILKCCLMILKCFVYDFEKLFNDFEMFFNDLSSSLINFVRSRDPVGEKTTKIGTCKGGRPKVAAPILDLFWCFFSDRVSFSQN